MPLSQPLSISIEYDQIRVSGTKNLSGGPVDGYLVEFIYDGTVVYTMISSGQDEVVTVNVRGSLDGQLANG